MGDAPVEGVERVDVIVFDLTAVDRQHQSRALCAVVEYPGRFAYSDASREVLKGDIVAPTNGILRDVMPAYGNSLRDAKDMQIRISKRYEDQRRLIANVCHVSQQFYRLMAAQRRLV
jgi:hypothetical protein